MKWIPVYFNLRTYCQQLVSVPLSVEMDSATSDIHRFQGGQCHPSLCMASLKGQSSQLAGTLAAFPLHLVTAAAEFSEWKSWYLRCSLSLSLV